MPMIKIKIDADCLYAAEQRWGPLGREAEVMTDGQSRTGPSDQEVRLKGRGALEDDLNDGGDLKGGQTMTKSVRLLWKLTSNQDR